MSGGAHQPQMDLDLLSSQTGFYWCVFLLPGDVFVHKPMTSPGPSLLKGRDSLFIFESLYILYK